MLQMILVIVILLAYLSSCSFSLSEPVASENMDVLHDNMCLPDLTEQAGTEAVQQVMRKKPG